MPTGVRHEEKAYCSQVMGAEFKFGIWERLAAVAFIAGVAGVVASMTLPPHIQQALAQGGAGHSLFWISAGIIILSVVFFLCDVTLFVLLRFGVRFGMALIYIGIALICAGIAVGFVGAFHVDKERAGEPPPPPSEVLLDYSVAHALPAAKFDSLGNIELIVFHMDDKTGRIHAGIMGYSGGTTSRDSSVDWSSIFPKKQMIMTIYKCDFTAVGQRPVFNASISADVEFREAIPHPNLSKSFDMAIATLGGPRLQDGDVVRKTTMKIDVRRVDPTTVHTLYAVNLTQFFVFAKISGVGTATETGGWRQRQIGITTSGPPVMAFAPSMWLP